MQYSKIQSLDVIKHSIDIEYFSDFKKDKINQFVKGNVSLESKIINKKMFFLTITSDCNLDCLYCFCSKNSFKKELINMNQYTAKRSIDYMFDSTEEDDYFDVYFFGGEPLLNYPVLEYSVNYIKKKANSSGKKINFYITTNGTLLSKDIMYFLSENFYYIGLSIDGDKDSQDKQRPFKSKNSNLSSYDVIIKNISYFLRIAGDRIHICSVLNPNNFNPLEVYKHFKNMGVKHLRLGPSFYSINSDFTISKNNIGYVLDGYKLLFNDYMEDIKNNKCSIYLYSYWNHILIMILGSNRQNGCGAGRSVFTISPEGGIYACHRSVNIDEYRLGYVGDKIDYSNNKFCLNHSREVFSKCKDCLISDICGGGCIWVNNCLNGSFSKVSDCYCVVQKMLVSQSIDIMMELFSDKM